MASVFHVSFICGSSQLDLSNISIQRNRFRPQVYLPVSPGRCCFFPPLIAPSLLRGGQLSSVKTLVNDATAAGLNIETIENIGPRTSSSRFLVGYTYSYSIDIDYARTLREWSYRFERNLDTHIRPALLKQYPQLTDEDIAIFNRKWMCKSFIDPSADDTHSDLDTPKTISHTVNRDLPCAVLLTMFLPQLGRYGTFLVSL